MLFNSIHFALFLPVVFLLYWFVTNRNLKIQNIVLLVASYFFYACWDWKFLFLLIFSTLLDYYTGIKMTEAKNKKIKKSWFWLSIIVNLGFLGIFKYYNFFAASFAASIAHLGIEINPWTLKVILPVGISFYTFHGLSYVIDIYKNRINAERNYIDYAVFVSFFPLLVAGPIERATHLLPQIKNKRTFDYKNAVAGLKQILWGLFKKVVIADQCATMANMIFNYSTDYAGSSLFLGSLFFTFQIYGDFSGYSDIAIGTAKLFGIDLLKNFAFPYFSRDIAEFWRRWHISLSSWFRDYLYIPLGGSKGGTWMKIRNTFIIFLVSGFWHGANWTFIAWGFLNALYIMPSIIFNTNRNYIETVAKNKRLPSFKESLLMLKTFGLTVFAWIFFRSESMGNALHFVSQMFAGIGNIDNYIETYSLMHHLGYVFWIAFLFFFITEWLGRTQSFAIENLSYIFPRWITWGVYYLIIALLLYFGNSHQSFIYFQF